MQRALVLSIGLAISLSASRAEAWGEAGHKMVAGIAQKRLTPAAAAAVLELMKEPAGFCEGQTCTILSGHEVALWADDWKKKIDEKHTDARYFGHPETSGWHYLNTPIAQAHVSATECPQTGCVTSEISAFTTGLTQGTDRFQALRFVVHFVGDVHQPLHCEDNKDGGGNNVLLIYPGHKGYQDGPPELHGVWDTDIIDDTMKSLGLTQQEYIDKLASIDDAQAKAWKRVRTPLEWAEESHALAVKAYAALKIPTLTGTQKPPATPTIRIPKDYAAKNQAIVEGQLQRAGVRLADLLNTALDPAYKSE